MTATKIIDCGVETIELASWRNFYDLVSSNLNNSPAYIYRGQADSTWVINSSIARLEIKYPTKKNYGCNSPPEFKCSPVSREVHLKAFRQAMRGRRGSNARELSDLECWIIGQHHGLATPMLDWTLSPFVALYFAFEEEHACSKRAVYALSSSLMNADSDKETEPVLIAPFAETTERLVAQSGLLLHMPQRIDLESHVRNKYATETSASNLHARSVLKKILIPNNERPECLKMLNKMNINRMTLYPDIDGAAQYISRLWELDFDTSLGYIAEQ